MMKLKKGDSVYIEYTLKDAKKDSVGENEVYCGKGVYLSDDDSSYGYEDSCLCLVPNIISNSDFVYAGIIKACFPNKCVSKYEEY